MAVSDAITNVESKSVHCLAKKRATLNFRIKQTYCDQCLVIFKYISEM